MSDLQEEDQSNDVRRSNVIASFPVIQEVLDWFETEMKEADSVSALPVNHSTDATDFKVEVLLSKSLGDKFKLKRDKFVLDFDEYLKEEDPPA